MLSTVYARTTGVKVNMSLKGSGEALAQLIAEKENPKTDVWFGGTGDPHLQAAEQGLSLEYKSATLPQLHDWAQQQAKDASSVSSVNHSAMVCDGRDGKEGVRRVSSLCPEGRPTQVSTHGRDP